VCQVERPKIGHQCTVPVSEFESIGELLKVSEHSRDGLIASYYRNLTKDATTDTCKNSVI